MKSISAIGQDSEAVTQQDIQKSSEKDSSHIEEPVLKTQKHPSISESDSEHDKDKKLTKGLKHLRITSSSIDNSNVKDLVNGRISANKNQIGDLDYIESVAPNKNESILLLKPENSNDIYQSRTMKLLHVVGVMMSMTWIGYCLVHASFNDTISGMAPYQFGGFMAGILAPVALFWMIFGHYTRGADIQRYSESLRSELQSIIFPTEERAQRVHKDIEQLCAQAGELASSSKSVIKSIARARQGLRSEARDFAGVSKKTEIHIDRLTDRLNERGAKLLALTEEIEQRTSHIDEKTHAGAEAWDQATLHILERAAEIESAMGQGASKILEAADKAGDKSIEIGTALESSFDNLNHSVDQVAKRLEGLSTQFDDHTKNLSKSADNVTTEAKLLSGSIEDQINNLETMTDRTLEVMGQASQAIADHRFALDGGAQEVSKQADRIADTINDSISKLSDAADYIVTKTDDLENRVSGQADKLYQTVETIDSGAQSIESASDNAAQKINQVVSNTESQIELINTVVGQVIDKLVNSTQSAQLVSDDMIKTTKAQIEDLAESGNHHAQQMRLIIDMLDTSRDQVSDASKLAAEQVDKLYRAGKEQQDSIQLSLVGMVERIGSVRDSLQTPIKDIVLAVGELDSKHQHIEDILAKRVKDLNEASGKAKDTSEHIRSILRGQAQDISLLAGQIAGHTRSINEQFITQKNALDINVKDSLQGIEQVQYLLEAKAQKLTEISVKAVNDVSALDQTFNARYYDVDQITTKAIKEFSALESSMEASVVTLRDLSEGATRSISDVTKALDMSTRELEPVCQDAIDRADKTYNRFEELGDTIQVTTDTHLERLLQVGTVFEERLEELCVGSNRAVTLLKDTSYVAQDRVEEIERSASSALEKLSHLDASLKDQSSDIHLSTDQVLIRFEHIQNVMNEQFQELSQSVGQATSQLQDAVEELDTSSECINQLASKIVHNFGRIGEKAVNESDRIDAAAKSTVYMTQSLIKTVYEESEKLLGSTKTTLTMLEQTGDIFAMKSQETKEHMNASLLSSKQYIKDLKDQTKIICEASTESADVVNKATYILTDTLDDIGNAASGVMESIEGSSERLGREAKRLSSVTSSALQATEDASDLFARQSDTMFRTVQLVKNRAEKLRTQEWKAQRDSFMSSAKFIVESLHSLSVDLTRQQEGDVPEKIWKAYKGGDISAFTRRLAQISDHLPIDKLRNKFAVDTEFRTYVQRFINQFEGLYDQAVSNDHGAILAATFVSSDVGKLYQILCSIADRPMKMNQDNRRAA